MKKNKNAPKLRLVSSEEKPPSLAAWYGVRTVISSSIAAAVRSLKK